MNAEELRKEIESFARMGGQLTGVMWQDYYKRCIKPLEDQLKKIEQESDDK